MKTIAFFNNKGGVGKTSLVYHLAWMCADLGLSVVAADLDPQANLTNMFLSEDRAEELYEADHSSYTVFGAFQPLLDGFGDIGSPYLEEVGHSVSLLPGDLSLSRAEDDLSGQWAECMDGKARAFRVISAFWRMLRAAAEEAEAQVVLIDVGPNLGALNRAALISADHVVIPLAPDLYSLQGLRNLGPTLHQWRKQWHERYERKPSNLTDVPLPTGGMSPVGYVVLQHAIRLDRPVQAYARWMDRIPSEYHEHLLGQAVPEEISVETDPECLALLKHYRSLMPLAQEARKPMFALKSADGVTGGHVYAVQQCYHDFNDLAAIVLDRCGVKTFEAGPRFEH